MIRSTLSCNLNTVAMGKSLLLLLSFSFFSTFWAFSQITYKNNCIRSGDEIIKEQVEFKDPGRSGENVIWNFSELKAINSKYKLSFHSPCLINDSIYIMGCDTLLKENSDINNLIIGKEHSTMYYYQVKNDTLFCLGHENPITLMHNKIPFPLMTYPFDYKQRIEHKFESEGIHSSQSGTNTFGNISIESDAYGKMILPTGDTLNHVVRIKTTQLINDTLYIKNNIGPNDISNIFLRKQLKKKVEKHHKQIEADTYSWYVQGYRYPVFETVQAFDVIDNLKKQTFAAAYFYPPVNHYYLDDDLDNTIVLDSLNNEKVPNILTNWINQNFSHNFWPNPVSTELNIEYKLEQGANVGITLYSSVHGIVKIIPVKYMDMGLYRETIDCSTLFPGAYIIQFNVENELISNIVLKK